MITKEPIEEFLPLLRGVVPDGQNKWKAYCPVHEATGEHRPSLGVMVGENGKVVLKCLACNATTPQIVHAAGSTMDKLFRRSEQHKRTSNKASRPIRFSTAELAIASTIQFYEKSKGWKFRAKWPYIKDRETLAYVLRFDLPGGSKEFRPISRAGDEWINKPPKELRPLYCGDSIANSQTVFALEGEKATDAAQAIGLTAVSSMNGAKSPRKSDWSAMVGKNVVILPDCDESGRSYAKDVAGLCATAGAKSIKIVELPGLGKGDDIVEWIANFGHDADKVAIRHRLDELVNQASEWSPRISNKAGTANSAEGPKSTVQNFELIEEEAEGGETKLTPNPISIGVIADDITRLTGDWPRSVCGQLFIHQEDHGRIHWLPDADALFSFLGHVTGSPPHFKASPGFHSKREVFSHIQRHATSYLAVEEAPHEPPIANHFYACCRPKPGNGDTLRKLIDRFSPETLVDWDLIWAAFVTPFWGGDGGTRPAFCITAPDRGAGKSKLVKFIAQLSGGYLDISSNEDIATLKTRLLSAEASTRRVVLFDNIKSSKLSWAELESLITCPIVSGKRMYVGEFQRPNSFTYFLTMNGVSFSRDMAQRCVVIRLKMPDYAGDWEAETQRFIEENRQALIEDVIGFLRQPNQELSRFSRWADWERAIVSKLPEPSDTQAVITERQIGVDIDNEEAAVIEEVFTKELEKLGYDTSSERVFIPTSIACRWLGWAMNERFTTTKSSQMLKQRVEARAFRSISMCRGRTNGRGFEFWGRNASGETILSADIESRMKMRGYSDV